MKKNILVISNDKLFKIKDVISTDFNDTINIIEGLSQKNQLGIFSRYSKIKRKFISKKNKYKSFPSINFFNIHKYNFDKIFMISITPFNFFVFLFLKIFNKNIKGYVYLRSDGHKEYYYKYKLLGFYIYEFMFQIVTYFLKTISVSKKLTGIKKNNFHLVYPSELNENWFLNRKKIYIDNTNINLLYLGRFKKEKGIFSLINLISKIHYVKLKIVGLKKIKNFDFKNIKFFLEKNSLKEIMSLYDECNIFILPSYTEGSPKVILESLARLRPIIIFNEIKHVKKSFKGIFISKRNSESLKKTIKYISNNYDKIIQSIKTNNLFTKKEFQTQINRIVR